MALSLATPNLSNSSTSPPSRSCASTFHVLHGHDAIITGAAVRGTSNEGRVTSSSLFATADASGRCLVWEYREFEDDEVIPSGRLTNRGKDVVNDAKMGDLMNWRTPSPYQNVCTLQTSTGASFLDISFMSSVAHPGLLAGAQGNQEVSLWDTTQGICLQGVHRWMRNRTDGEGHYGIRRPSEHTRKRKRGDFRSASNLAKNRNSVGSVPPSPWPVVNCVLPLPDFSAAGPHALCFGGDDGYVAVYDVRSGVIEWTLKQGVPVTAMASAAGKAYQTSSFSHDPRRQNKRAGGSLGLSCRTEQLFIGDATGHVRWVDLRSGYRGSLMSGGGPSPRSHEKDALASIWLGKTVITDIIVPYYDGKTFYLPKEVHSGTDDHSFSEQNDVATMEQEIAEAAVAITSGEEMSTSNVRESMLPRAMWLDMKPFASSDAERIVRSLPLVSVPPTTFSFSSSASFGSVDIENANAEEGAAEGRHRHPRWFWRGEVVESVGGGESNHNDSSTSTRNGGSELVLPYCSVGSSFSQQAAAQLVHTNRFSTGAWRQLCREGGEDSQSVPTMSSSSLSNTVDRRVTRALGLVKNKTIPTGAMSILSTCGNEVVVYEG